MREATPPPRAQRKPRREPVMRSDLERALVNAGWQVLDQAQCQAEGGSDGQPLLRQRLMTWLQALRPHADGQVCALSAGAIEQVLRHVALTVCNRSEPAAALQALHRGVWVSEPLSDGRVRWICVPLLDPDTAAANHWDAVAVAAPAGQCRWVGHVNGVPWILIAAQRPAPAGSPPGPASPAEPPRVVALLRLGLDATGRWRVDADAAWREGSLRDAPAQDQREPPLVAREVLLAPVHLLALLRDGVWIDPLHAGSHGLHAAQAAQFFAWQALHAKLCAASPGALLRWTAPVPASASIFMLVRAALRRWDRVVVVTDDADLRRLLQQHAGMEGRDAAAAMAGTASARRWVAGLAGGSTGASVISARRLHAVLRLPPAQRAVLRDGAMAPELVVLPRGALDAAALQRARTLLRHAVWLVFTPGTPARATVRGRAAPAQWPQQQPPQWQVREPSAVYLAVPAASMSAAAQAEAGQPSLTLNKCRAAMRAAARQAAPAARVDDAWLRTQASVLQAVLRDARVAHSLDPQARLAALHRALLAPLFERVGLEAARTMLAQLAALAP